MLRLKPLRRSSFIAFIFTLACCIVSSPGFAQDATSAAEGYSIPKQIQYSYTLHNNTNGLLKNVEFWAHAPVKQTATQYCVHMESSHSYQLITDKEGNQVLHFALSNFPPYATQLIMTKAQILVSRQPNPLPLKDISPYLAAEDHIESASPDVILLANTLKADTVQQTAKKIFQWVANNIRYGGYASLGKGALYTLRHRTGDCTEFMQLFVALCRAGRIPARCMAGYVYRNDAIMRSREYHNWAEFYDGGLWKIVDPQKKVFINSDSFYVAMRIIRGTKASSTIQFDRFNFQEKGLVAHMND